MVLKAHEEGITGTLVYGNTRLNLAGSMDSVNRLTTYVKWPVHVVRYEGERKPIQVLKESFHKLPQAIEHMKETGVFRRNMFQCCNILKHGPMIKWSKQQSKDACFVLGIKGSDGAIHRRYRMSELRERNTFYRRHKSNGLLYYYPLRDWTQQQVEDKLREYGFSNIKSTGCSICPIFCMFESWRKKDPNTWRRSVQFADKLGVKHPAMGQQFLPQICSEITQND
jgi:3'-phosphoadenosine 5'-phosphosulfate sulfotransferase (PAPS reductase)/FAD synthetase